LPEIRVLGDELLHKGSAFRTVKDKDLYATLAEVGLAAKEGLVFADYYTGDAVKEASAGAFVQVNLVRSNQFRP
jgi:hypothetical protein